MIVSLYTTLGCHLCDDALALLRQLHRQGLAMEIKEVEIIESEVLMSTYGVRIPVITSDCSEGDIGWPFSLEELRLFLDKK